MLLIFIVFFEAVRFYGQLVHVLEHAPTSVHWGGRQGCNVPKPTAGLPGLRAKLFLATSTRSGSKLALFAGLG
jgi:hypothetical protein